MWLIALQLALSQVHDPVPATWDGVATGELRGVAVWDTAEVFWSSDGATFARVLDGHGDVDAVALDRDGTAWVARAEGLVGSRGEDGVERWVDIGAHATEGLWVRGKHVVWLGRRGEDEEDAVFMVSVDGGRRFVERPEWPAGRNAWTELSISAGGRVDYVTGWEAGCGGGYQERHAGAITARRLTDVGWPIDAPVDRIPGPGGWFYAPADCGDERGVCAVRTGRKTQRLDIEASEDWPYLRGARAGDRTWLVAAQQLYEVRADVVVSRRGPVPEGTTHFVASVDQMWVLADRGLHTLGADGWRAVKVR